MDKNSSYSSKYNLYPIQDKSSFDFYRKQVLQMWDAQELRLGEDKYEFMKLSTRYQELIADLLAFFAPGDGLVSNQVIGFLNKAKNFEQQAFLIWQLAIEVIHAQSYADAIQTFFDVETQVKISTSVDTLPCVKAKADFIFKYMDNPDLPIGVKYIAGAVSEGIFFVSLFAMIFYLRSKGILKRFCFMNEQVLKDECLHRDYNLMIAKRYKDVDFVREKALEILRDAINIEKDHIRYILRTPIDSREGDEISGMTIGNIDRYVATLADQILMGLGYQPEFTTSTPGGVDGKLEEFSPYWMQDASLTRKTNFYEGDPGDYTRGSKFDDEKKVESSEVYLDPSNFDI